MHGQDNAEVKINTIFLSIDKFDEFETISP